METERNNHILWKNTGSVRLVTDYPHPTVKIEIETLYAMDKNTLLSHKNFLKLCLDTKVS